ncbi:MAG TPA: hypothetical protein VIG73_05545 [Cerasibacillus sp.]|uniref:hypothetical protein n=1 Tax=Cerasibacillus sp. TaxID=2498711 RepID=UPI002F3FAF0E
MGIFFEFLGAFFEVFEIALYYMFKNPDEDDINKNIRELKKYAWFQDFLQDGRIRELIVHDKKIRRVIGKMNYKKFDRPFYQYRCEEKLRKILMKKMYTE